MEVLKKISKLKAELDHFRPLDKETEARIMQKFRLDWNYHSNHIEGNTLTYGETKALILFGITARGKPLKDHLEITGHNEVVKWIESILKQERPITETFIRDLHELLLKKSYESPTLTPDGIPATKRVKVGDYKTDPNHVLTKTGEMFYFATPEETPAKMGDLMKWFREKKKQEDTHALLIAAEFHYKFIRIHPFDDGNGRTARILMNFILMQAGYPPVIIKTEDRANYLAALQQADAGLLESFMEYIGENLEQSLEIMLKGARGESIEEPDDVDKKIALLEQRLKEIKPSNRKKKSIENIRELFTMSLFQLIDEFINVKSKFKHLYQDFSFKIKVFEDGKNRNINKNWTIEDLNNVIMKGEGLMLYSIQIDCFFSKFYIEGLDKFSYFSQLMINFREEDFVINDSQMSNELVKLYGQGLSQIEKNKIIQDATQNHLHSIEKQIERMQKPNN